MQKKKSSSLLSSYRKKRKTGRGLVLGLMVVLIIAGLTLVGLWASGKLTGAAWPMFATKTPTPTLVPPTATPTETPEPSRTPTMTNTPTITLTPTPDGPFDYVVTAEDLSCYDIANKFNTNLQSLYQVNGWTECIYRVGQTIKIPQPGFKLPTETPIPTDTRPGTIIDVIVEPGASLNTIAQYYLSIPQRIVDETNKYLANRGDALINLDTPLQEGWLLKVPYGLITPVPTNTPTRTSTPTP